MVNQEAIKKYKDELKSLKDTLTKYGDLFNADGTIDAKEQAQLDNMQAIIKKAEVKLMELEKGGVENENKGSGLIEKIKHIGILLDELETKLGIK